MADLEYQPVCVCTDGVIQLYKGRNRTIRITISTEIDITNAKLWMLVKDDIDDDDADAVITKLSANNGGADTQALITDVANRVVEFYIDPADTLSLDEGLYSWDAVIELASGERYQLQEPSRFDLLQPTTLTS